mmetsp:Transcript_78480/g.163043  ORF Transcript_78480/g.163043 Transcript_78480/m.163043 type:complete len:844 (+) Transcript_78480:81-2612(+)
MRSIIPLQCLGTILALALVSSDAASSVVYIEDEDETLAAQAASLKDDVCSSISDVEVDEEAGRESLVSFMGTDENIVLTSILAASNTDEVTDNIKDEVLDAGYIISVGYPIGVGVFILVCYFGFCCSAYPCCQCCRCCKQKEPLPHTKKMKIICFIFLVLAVIGIIIASIVGIVASNKAVNGFDRVSCASSTLLDTVLSGSTTSPTFVGLLPALRIVESVDNSLDDGSEALETLYGILNQTDPMREAGDLVTAIIKAISTNIGDEDNTAPADATGSLNHDCSALAVLADPLSEIADTLGSSLGSMIIDARQSAADVLSVKNTVQQSIRDAASALVDLKKAFRNLEGFIKDDGAFYQVRDNLDSQAIISSLGLTLWALLILCCASCSMGAYYWKEVSQDKNGETTFSKSPHRCACLAWGCALIPVLAGCLVGGIISVVSSPLASVCDIMDKLSEPLLVQMSPGLELAIDDDGLFSIPTLVGTCVAPEDTSMNANILELIQTEANGTKVSMKEFLGGQVTEPVDMAFDSLAAVADLTTSVVTDSVQALREQIAANPFRGTCLPTNVDTATLGDDDLAVAATTTMLCADSNSSLDGVSTTTLTGMATLNDLMSSVSLTEMDSTMDYPCAKTFTCDPTSSRQAQCNAANDVIAYKERMLAPNLFDCRRFVNEAGEFCNPGDMTFDSTTNTWSNDCIFVQENGQTGTKAVTASCNITELEDLILELNGALLVSLTRFDSEAQRFLVLINSDLRDAMYEYIITPVMDLVEGIRCGFMAEAWDGLVAGLCFEGVVGLGTVGRVYFAEAMMLVYMAIVMYVFWRMAIDNVNLENRKKQEAKKQAANQANQQ